MSRRKEYRRPTVESEEILEQASLACTATAEGSEVEGTFTAACRTDVTKNGAFVEADVYCTVWLIYPNDLVILS